MGATVAVLYPPDADIKMDYYLNTHMPMVQEKWGPGGLQGYTVAQFVSLGDGSPAPYSLCTNLNFESIEAFQAVAAGPHIAEIMGDIKNFTEKVPILIIGNVVGTH